MRLVPDRYTPLDEEQAMDALAQGYERFMGRQISAPTLAVFWAQSALETGRWRKMHCFNWGNTKVPRDWDGDYCQYRCNELIDGKYQWFDPPHRQTWFVAFQSAAEGAAYYYELLALADWYRPAWAQAFKGDPAGFVNALKAAGYMTAELVPYRNAVVSLFHHALPMAEAYLAGKRVLFTQEDREKILGLVALSMTEGLSPENHDAEREA